MNYIHALQCIVIFPKGSAEYQTALGLITQGMLFDNEAEDLKDIFGMDVINDKLTEQQIQQILQTTTLYNIDC